VPQGKRNFRTAVIFALLLAASAAGCADLYYDRRDTISLHGGDAVAANKIAQTIDPWPRAVANNKIDADGVRMQRAIERYKTNRTTPLQTTSTSSLHYQPVLAPGSGGGASP